MKKQQQQKRAKVIESTTTVLHILYTYSKKKKMSDVMEKTESKSKFYAVLPILLCGLSIPLSLFLWLGNLAFTFLTNNSADSEGEVLSFS